MPLFDSIATLVAAGPDQWLTAPPPGLWYVRQEPAFLARAAFEPDWVSICNDVVLPTLDHTAVGAVATGTVGLWVHARLRRPPCDGIRIVYDPAHTRGAEQLASTLGRYCRAGGWTLDLGHVDGDLVAGSILRGTRTLPLLITAMTLPDDAYDSVFGQARWSVAEWVLAVEALAHVTRDPSDWMAVAGLVDLYAILDDIPEVIWTEALRGVPASRIRPWIEHATDLDTIPGLKDLPALHEAGEGIQP